MNAFPPSQFGVTHRLAAILLVLAGLPPTASRANSSKATLVEVQGQFVNATKSQLAAALEAAHDDGGATVLSASQYKAVRASLAKAGAETFSEPRAVSQSGQEASAEVVQELRYATKYEPSKKESGRFVPTKFATRPVGVILKAVPSVDAGGRIQLRATGTFTRFLGFVDFSNLAPNAKNAPTLEGLLKAPLHAGAIWQPIFATFTATRDFELKDGETAVMAGTVGVEPPDFPAGQPALQSSVPAPEVAVFLTARKVVRE